MGLARPACGQRVRTAGLVAVAMSAAVGLSTSALVGACSSTARNRPAASPSPTAPAQDGPVSPVRATETPAGAPARTDRTETQRGYASWYGAALAGHRMANGAPFDPRKMTAAHRTLPLGTWVEVRRTEGAAASVRVQITDRGPFGHADRIIDLSRAAADKLGMRKSGLAPVEVRVVSGP